LQKIHSLSYKRWIATAFSRSQKSPSSRLRLRAVNRHSVPHDFLSAALHGLRYTLVMIDRRYFVAIAGATTFAALAPRLSHAAAMSRISAYAFTFRGLDGGDILLAAYAGHPILVVNTASLCGYTPQYAGLQELWTRYRGKGFVVVGVPSNDFGGQEPGGAVDIGNTAHGEFHVTFPLADKVAVKGKDAHPFYRWAALERPLEAPRWNFHKYLIGRDGRLVAGFTSAMEPTDSRIVAAIEKELADE
jgi:glutathione peroxidase